MGLDQFILRGNHYVPVKITDGKWSGADEILQLRKAYWLHNKMLKIGKRKLGLDYDELNCKPIPVSKDELLDIVKQAKTVRDNNSRCLLDEYFNYNVDSDSEWECIKDEIKDFNITLNRYLKNTKKVDYWYYAWW